MPILARKGLFFVLSLYAYEPAGDVGGQARWLLCTISERYVRAWEEQHPVRGDWTGWNGAPLLL